MKAAPKMRRLRCCWAVFLAGGALLWASVALADQKAIVSLSVDHVAKGDVVALLRPHDILLKLKDLDTAGLRNVSGRREKIGGEWFVSLKSLAPAITYSFDAKAVTLSLTVPPANLVPTSLDLKLLSPPAGMVHSTDTSFFLNYSANVTNLAQVSSFEEGGLSLFGNTLVYSSLYFTPSPGGEQAVRGLTNLTYDDWSSNLRRWVIGDSFAASIDPLGGTGYVGGFSVSKDFALDPYFISYPQQSFSGALAVPATLDVYTNGGLVRHELLPPGPFTLQNIPMAAGVGTTQIVIRNIFGQVEQITSPYYLNTSTLAEGLSQYSYNVGFLRNNLGTASFQYGPAVFQGSQRYGLTDWLTPGFRLEAAAKLFSGGPMVSLSSPLGGFSGSLAWSEFGSMTGYAGSFTYTYLRNPYGFTGQFEFMSPRYANISLPPTADRPKLAASLFLSVPLGSRLTILPGYTYADYRDQGVTSTASVSAEVRLSERSFLIATGERVVTAGAPPALGVTINLTFMIGQLTSATVTYGSQRGGPEGTAGNLEGVNVQRSLPLGPGLGYNFNFQNGQGTQQQMLGDLQYNGNYGFYEADAERQGGVTTSDLTLSGGLVWLDGHFFATRPVQDAYALIETPGLSGVTGSLYNQPEGTTDGNGNLLVPNLFSYFGNQLSINPQNVPLNYRIDATSEVVAPPYRGGAVVRFPVHPVQGVTGKLVVVVKGRPVVPAFGELTLAANGKEYSSPIGRKGEFYLDSPPAGQHPAKVEFKEGVCSFTVAVPKTRQFSVKLGTLTCRMP